MAMWQKNNSGMCSFMIMQTETLYYFAIVLYVMLFFMQLIKKKYRLFQMAVFFFTYASTVFLIKLCIFPLMIGETPYRNTASLVPFSVLTSALAGVPGADGMVLKRFLALIAIAAFLGFTIPILLRKKAGSSLFLPLSLFCSLWKRPALYWRRWAQAINCWIHRSFSCNRLHGPPDIYSIRSWIKKQSYGLFARIRGRYKGRGNRHGHSHLNDPFKQNIPPG